MKIGNYIASKLGKNRDTGKCVMLLCENVKGRGVRFRRHIYSRGLMSRDARKRVCDDLNVVFSCPECYVGGLVC